jgi:hypothetical protein
MKQVVISDADDGRWPDTMAAKRDAEYACVARQTQG